jgi:hypothetical protein
MAMCIDLDRFSCLSALHSGPGPEVPRIETRDAELYYEAEEKMAKSRLKHVAVTVGAAMERAETTRHNIAEARVGARKELTAISRQVMALRRQLLKNTEGNETRPVLT